MKNLLLCVILAMGWQAGAINLDAYDYEVFAQSGGYKTNHNGAPVFMVKIPEKAKERIDTQRMIERSTVHSQEDVDTLPWINREYFIKHLEIIDRDLEEALRRKSTAEELLFAWVLGLKKFGKYEYSVEKLDQEEDKLRLRLFQALRANKDRLSGAHPPPLPTDGRKPVSNR